MPNFNADLSLGSLLTMATIIVAAFFAVKQSGAVLNARFIDFRDSMRELLSILAERLEKHEVQDLEWMTRYEALHREMTGDLQRLLGRLEQSSTKKS